MSFYKQVLENIKHIAHRDHATKEHWTLLKRFIEHGHKPNIIHHIGHGIETFLKSDLGLHYHSYGALLEKLRTHFTYTLIDLIKSIYQHDHKSFDQIFHHCEVKILHQCLTENLQCISQKGTYVLTTSNEYPLMSAIISNNKIAFEKLVQYKVSIPKKLLNSPINKNGETLLHIACQNNFYEAIKWLIQNRANPHIKKNDGQTTFPIFLKGYPFISVIINNDKYNFNKLIRYKIIPKHLLNISINQEQETLLHSACSNNFYEAAKWLIENGADINLTRNDGATPLHLACSEDNINIILLLINNGAFLNRSWHFKEMNQTPLMILAMKDNLELFKKLEARGAIYEDSLFNYISKRETPKIWIYLKEKLGITNYKLYLLNKGPLLKLPKKKKPTLLEAIGSRIFCDITQQEIILYKKLQNLIMIPYFRPLLIIVALANLGKYRKTKCEKKFKTFISNEDNVAKLVLSDKETIGFSNNNSIYLANNGKLTIISYIHEVIHFVCQEVFNNKAYPYSTGNETSFQKILTIVQNKLSKIKPINHLEKEALNILKIGLDNEYYSPDKFANELIARTGEIFAFLGKKQGLDFLSKNFPELLDYYINQFIPDCEEHLKKANVDQYLDLNDLSNSSQIVNSQNLFPLKTKKLIPSTSIPIASAVPNVFSTPGNENNQSYDHSPYQRLA